MDRVYIPLNVAGTHLLDADILSYRNGPASWWPHTWPNWLCGKGIAVAGRGDECHTGLVCKDNGHVVALGMRLARQKLKLLSDEVDDNPGLIDVYRYVGYARWTGVMPYLAPGLHYETRRAIVNEVRRFALHDEYGWWTVARTSAYFVPGLRWFAQPHYDEVEQMVRPPHCSQSISFAFRKHEVPLLKRRADRQVLPGDLVTSPLLLYMYTLLPAAAESEKRPMEFYYDRMLRERNRRRPQILSFSPKDQRA